MFRADLHCHSTCSDGTVTPEGLIALAKEIGLSGLSITDHDSVDAYESAIPAARAAGIRLGSGAEFSTVDHGVSIHVLAYDIDLKHPDLHAFCKRHIERRTHRNRQIIEKLAAHGMEIDPESLESRIAGGMPVGRPHIAEALIEKGYAKTINEAFQKWIGDGKPCFDPGFPITTDETIELIHQVGGKAFIAHPHLIRKSSHIPKLLEKPFDGIEAYYGTFSADQEKKWLKLAEDKKLLISGGSDFHGEIKPAIRLGCSWVDQEHFERIFEKKL